MGKILSDKERKLQKKLIPLNIFVCILCIVSIVSLMFLPILKIDAGKILRSDAMQEMIESVMDEKVDEGLEGSSQEGIDFIPVVGGVIRNVLGSAEGSLRISAFSSAKVAFSSGDSKSDMVLDELLFGENALVTKLVDSIVDGVAGIFKSEEGKELIEQVVVKSIVTGLASQTDVDITAEQIDSLVGSFKKIEEVTDGNPQSFAEGFVDDVQSVLGKDVVPDDAREDFITEITDLYNEASSALESGQNVTVENFVCVALSKHVELSEYNINDILAGLLGDENSEGASPASHALVEEALDVDGEAGDSGSDNNEELPDVGEEQAPDVGGEEPDNNGGDVSDTGTSNVICTTYTDVLAEMGFDESNMDELKETLRGTLQTMVNDAIGDISEVLGFYGYLFYGMLSFIVPWFILFLFSFFHMIAKNKRFMMWYVKLYSFIPGLISLAIILFPILIEKVNILKDLTADVFEGDMGPVIKAVLSGVSSYMWISGICYILLWLVSIFWAFPIKHKIRKERKLCKRAMKNGTYDYPTAPAFPANGYGTDSFGGYSSDGAYGGYNSDGFDDVYNGYDSLGGSYDSFGGYDSYGSDFGSDFGSDYGSGFGSSGLFDDDDDY